MKVLALDQSSKVTGYAIFNNGDLESYGKFDYKQTNPVQRIAALKKDVLAIIKENDIQEVILEDIQMQKNVNNVATFKILAFVLGNLEVLLQEKDIKYQVVASSTWKSKCGIKGKARAEQKKDAQRFVLEVFEVKAIQDIVDAICIGYSALELQGTDLNWL